MCVFNLLDTTNWLDISRGSVGVSLFESDIKLVNKSEIAMIFL